MLQLGTIQIAIRDYDSALNSLQEALTIRRSASSNLVGSARKNARNSNAMQIGNILSRIGLLHYEVEEYLSAATAFEEALHIYRSCLSQDSCPHAVIAETLVNLGSVRCKRKQYSQAIVAFEEAITVCNKMFFFIICLNASISNSYNFSLRFNFLDSKDGVRQFSSISFVHNRQSCICLLKIWQS